MEWFIGLLVLSGVEALVDGLMGLDYMLTHTHFYNLASDVWHLEEGLWVDGFISLWVYCSTKGKDQAIGLSVLLSEIISVASSCLDLNILR